MRLMLILMMMVMKMMMVRWEMRDVMICVGLWLKW